MKNIYIHQGKHTKQQRILHNVTGRISYHDTFHSNMVADYTLYYTDCLVSVIAHNQNCHWVILILYIVIVGSCQNTACCVHMIFTYGLRNIYICYDLKLCQETGTAHTCFHTQHTYLKDLTHPHTFSSSILICTRLLAVLRYWWYL